MSTKKAPQGTSLKIGGLLFIVLVISQALLLGKHFFSDEQKESPEDKFLRAAYVLQKMGGPAAQEEVTIPTRIKRSDAAEDLLHHPDRLYVLRKLTDDLEDARTAGIQAATLFEGYARLGLGETETAARLLSDYVAENPYQARHYKIICTLLEEMRDYSAMLRICAEWKEREPDCINEIAIFSWTALCKMERYREAASYMLQNGSCLGRNKYFYAARAVQEIPGEEQQAANLLEAAREGIPGDDHEGGRLWNKLLSMSLK